MNELIVQLINQSKQKNWKYQMFSSTRLRRPRTSISNKNCQEYFSFHFQLHPHVYFNTRFQLLWCLCILTLSCLVLSHFVLHLLAKTLTRRISFGHSRYQVQVQTLNFSPPKRTKTLRRTKSIQVSNTLWGRKDEYIRFITDCYYLEWSKLFITKDTLIKLTFI